MKIKPQTLPDDPAELKALVQSLQEEMKLLREQLHILISKRFGRSSEKYDPNQLGLFDEAELIGATAADDVEESATDKGGAASGHSRKKRGRKPFPDWLNRVEVIHELPESERRCGVDGSELVEIGREVSEQLDIVPAKVQVIRNIQIKYGCPHCKSGVKTAPAPRRPIPKLLGTAAMLAHVVVSKYADGLPLYRQGSILTRAGIDLPRNTLAHWMILAGREIQPLINLMRDQLLAYPIIQMDETPVQVLKEPQKIAQSKSYMWVQRGGPPDKPIILFHYDPTRSSKVPKDLLADYKGYLQTDAYAGYLDVAAQPDIIHLGCMSHARRKFDEAIKALGTNKNRKATRADEALTMVQQLYAIEKELRKDEADAETRFKVRQAKAKPVMAELRVWLEKNLPLTPPKSALGKAMAYLFTEWRKLIRYLDDGRLEIDNNACENAIRPFVIGRKGWLFSTSVKGVKASANLYSLIETAKANGLEPFAYFQHLFTKLPYAERVDDFDRLLPWNVDKADLSTS
ncbi:transposase IS66 [Magnetococcus marinus MC-1]|uniref:Transposase IS66 n=1 Tax=Magnetococcus marinus (strain ATCC BAA-1437 / JCM 17883 / MC-1) TaxID=156889 RepID=A0LAX3_MAGMM|nr:IS66 family transposase [Magnetococcus marinus]ABK45116.1 transposase IS66 [Magnetococcus marinus MC-1]ABK45146.1 transposase IS66 [Magnetococcus marinus MC-1]